MSYMTWTKPMSVGVPELDDDHKTLIHIINQLSDGTKDADPRSTVRQCLSSLMRYAEYHFAREESVMTACNFPAGDAHKAEHRKFTAMLSEKLDELDGSHDKAVARRIGKNLLSYLRDWLRNHILVIDMAYRPSVENNPEASRAAQRFKAAHVWWRR